MVNNYNTLITTLKSFSTNHLSLRRFKCSFFEQMDNFTTLENSFPILYAIPNDVSFDENIDEFSFRVYCVDILQKDRSNESSILNETLLVLRDLTNWIRLDKDVDLNILNTPVAVPVNNFLTEFTVGWYVDITLEVSVVTSDCSIPFSGSFQFPGVICDNVYVSRYLTCATLGTCSTFISLENRVTTLEGVTASTSPYQYNNNTINGIEPVTGSNATNVDNSSILGGENNVVNSGYSSILGGNDNIVNGNSSSILGGSNNDVGGFYSVILGGENNMNFTDYSIVGGNTNQNNGDNSSILGGANNNNNGDTSTIVGGVNNQNDGISSSILGGENNLNIGDNSSILSGSDNQILAHTSSILGGGFNIINKDLSSILGGTNNFIDGDYSVILGGQDNAIYHDNTFVLGSNITTIRTNTTYVDFLNIKNKDEATQPLSDLVIDSNGMVKINKLFYIGVNFEDVVDWNYIAPEDFKINSIDNPSVILYTITINGLPYTFGDTISLYDEITISPSSIGFLKLNSELI